MTDIKALCERLQSLADEWHECCGDIHVPLLEAKATLEAQAAQDAVHWATRRTLLAERDSARAELKSLEHLRPFGRRYKGEDGLWRMETEVNLGGNQGTVTYMYESDYDSARAEVKALRKAGDELQSEANRLAGNVGCDEHDDIWFVLEQYENTRAALKGEET